MQLPQGSWTSLRKQRKEKDCQDLPDGSVVKTLLPLRGCKFDPLQPQENKVPHAIWQKKTVHFYHLNIWRSLQ